jgi:hypothetical protein
MHQVFDGVMAVGAIEPAVNGVLKGIGGEDRQRNGFAGDHTGGGGVGMAVQAILVGNGVRRQAASLCPT